MKNNKKGRYKKPTQQQIREFWKHGIHPILGYKFNPNPLVYVKGCQSEPIRAEIRVNTFKSHTNEY